MRLQSNKRSWKRRRVVGAKRLSLKLSISELQNWIQQCDDLIDASSSSQREDNNELYDNIDTEIISKKDELKGIELLVNECVDEISSDGKRRTNASLIGIPTHVLR